MEWPLVTLLLAQCTVSSAFPVPSSRGYGSALHTASCASAGDAELNSSHIKLQEVNSRGQVVKRLSLQHDQLHWQDAEKFTAPSDSRFVSWWCWLRGRVSPAHGLQFLSQTFLPIGYPHSVPPEYAQFQVWNLLQDLCSYLRGVMATRALLLGMGVGRSDVTPIQATLQWIFRDGASLVGGLVFTSLSSYRFGQDVKLWRLFADGINNVGITLDLIAPYFPRQFLSLVCLGSICKALCGVAAGATNAVIAAHWGRVSGNLADVQAKNGAQHNMVSIVGLVAGIPFAKLADSASHVQLWILYFSLTVVHMFSNFRAMRILTLHSLNITRYKLLVKLFLALHPVRLILQLYSNKEPSSLSTDREAAWINYLKHWLHVHSCLFSPKHIASVEPIFSLVLPQEMQERLIDSISSKAVARAENESQALRTAFGLSANIPSLSSLPLENPSGRTCKLSMWAKLSAIIADGKWQLKDLQRTVALYSQEQYLLMARDEKDSVVASVCIKSSAQSRDVAKAMFELHLFPMVLNLEAARTVTNHLFPIFWDSIQAANWNTADCGTLLRPLDADTFTTE